MRIYQRLPGFNGVGAGQEATLTLPIGRAYHALDVLFSGVTLAQMTLIELVAEGVTIFRATGEDLDVMNQYNGLQAAATNSVLTIPLDRLGMITPGAVNETILNTGSRGEDGRGIYSLELRIKIAAGASGPSLEAYAWQSEQRDGGAGTVKHLKQFVRTAQGAGEFQISDLDYGGPTTLSLNKSYIFGSNIDKVTIERALNTVFERTDGLNNHVQKQAGIRVPQSDLFVVDPTETGIPGNAISLAGFSDFRYKLEMSSGEQLTIYNEYLGLLGS